MDGNSSGYKDFRAPVKLEKYWHGLFELGILVRSFNGIWETICGVVILFFSKSVLSSFLFLLARGELLEDPNDRVIRYIANLLQDLSTNTKVFAAIYILGHGILNIFLGIQLYRNRLWSYVITIAVMIIFIGYQVYRINIHHSHALIVVTAFDFLFLILTVHEYRYQRSRLVG